jgi:two-component system NtrC family sensor kinase
MPDLIPEGPVPNGGAPLQNEESLISDSRYRRLLWGAILSISFVALAPLVIMTWINYRQYEEAFTEEQSRPLVRLVANGKQSLEDFLEARTAALNYILLARSYEELDDPATLKGILENMKASFGGFIDMGIIGADGTQVAYAGPFQLEGQDYSDFPWFQEVTRRGTFVSEVFLGLRDSPHFIIAVYRELAPGRGYVLRATIDTEYINRLVRTLLHQPGGDVFLIDQNGVLQTTPLTHGGVLERAPIPSLPLSMQAEVMHMDESQGGPRDLVYASITGSPFTLVMLGSPSVFHRGWTVLRRNLLIFLALSSVLILGVVIWGSTWAVRRARDADLVRAAAYHKMEYQNKMAALGRLSAGVAHEINNPVSIISQSAGLLKDLILMRDTPPPKERQLELLDSVLSSADRCGGITHRLLGFAKHMDVQTETIDLGQLLQEVLGFLGKEAGYRDIQVDFDFPEEPVTVDSDRGQLQQVFLNIINNAFAAIDDGGNIQIGITRPESGAVSVWVQDDGVGIPEDHLHHIFDPFFSTKKGAGTGLGLSITYGIVQKLGGDVSVRSRVGFGTRFVVTLPNKKSDAKEYS